MPFLFCSCFICSDTNSMSFRVAEVSLLSSFAIMATFAAEFLAGLSVITVGAKSDSMLKEYIWL